MDTNIGFWKLLKEMLTDINCPNEVHSKFRLWRNLTKYFATMKNCISSDIIQGFHKKPEGFMQKKKKLLSLSWFMCFKFAPNP